VKKFKDNEDVAFADVNLSEEQCRESHGEDQSPGAGGWPTIRYFNKGTGYGGKPYAKKTDDAMCTELGNDKYMQQYIEEAGGTSLCSIAEGNPGCGDKEKKYIAKWASADSAKIESQLTRLTGMAGDGSKMKEDLMQWINQRIAILKQYQKAGGGEKKEL
jgi:hypothetical protein